MTFLLILMLSIFNPPQLVVVFETNIGDQLIMNTKTFEETYAYKQGFFMHEFRSPMLFPGYSRTINDLNTDKKSRVSKQFEKLFIHHFDDPLSEFIKKMEVADYSISYHKEKKKVILGYEAYKAVIKDSTNNKTIIAFISEEITNTRFHKLQFRYPLLKGLPLAYEDGKRSSIAIEISQNVDQSLFEVNEEDAFMVLDDEGLKKMVPMITGALSYEEFAEYLKSLSKDEFDNNN